MFHIAIAGGASAGGTPPRLDVVMLVGFLAMVWALATLSYAGRSRSAAVSFAAAVGVLGAYCFAAGAWPAGVVMLAAAVAFVVARVRRMNWANSQVRASVPFDRADTTSTSATFPLGGRPVPPAAAHRWRPEDN